MSDNSFKGFDPTFVTTYFSTVKNMASPHRPLHRAKAMKVTLRANKEFVKSLNQDARDGFWTQVKTEGWVSLDPQGHIVGLGENAQKWMKS